MHICMEEKGGIKNVVWFCGLGCSQVPVACHIPDLSVEEQVPHPSHFHACKAKPHVIDETTPSGARYEYCYVPGMQTHPCELNLMRATSTLQGFMFFFCISRSDPTSERVLHTASSLPSLRAS